MAFFRRLFTRSQEQDDALDQGLAKTRTSLWDRLSRSVAGKRIIDAEVLDEVEAALLQADVGVETTVHVIKALQARAAKDKYLTTADLQRLMREEVASLFSATPPPQLGAEVTPRPYVILVVGVNGVGKTTTIGKLAHLLKSSGYSVLLGAADTFRAAAVEQLKTWGQRVGVPVVDKGMGADPSSVAYEAVQAGVAQGADVIIIDTAGRLHTKSPLMAELTKVRRTVAKVLPEAPHEVLLVLDASTGQNALQQAQEFSKATDVTALALTKLDGTAKGGVVLAIAHRLGVPVRYLGVGERAQDLQPFDAQAFVEKLLKA